MAQKGKNKKEHSLELLERARCSKGPCCVPCRLVGRSASHAAVEGAKQSDSNDWMLSTFRPGLHILGGLACKAR